MQVSEESFEVGVVQFCWLGSKLRECGDTVRNIDAARYVAVHDFTEESPIAETHFVFKELMFSCTFSRTASASTKIGFIHLVDAIFR